jgi:hypothetical protein
MFRSQHELYVFAALRMKEAAGGIWVELLRNWGRHCRIGRITLKEAK